jgi:hypothetical protein
MVFSVSAVGSSTLQMVALTINLKTGILPEEDTRDIILFLYESKLSSVIGRLTTQDQTSMLHKQIFLIKF